MTSLARNIGLRILRKKQKKLVRKTRVHNFQTARSAVLLFDTSVKNAFPVIKSFKDYLNEQHIDCSVIGFVNEKEVPDQMLLRNHYEFITQKDTNWYKKPKGEVVNRFMDTVPDLLFDFTFNQSVEIQYLIKLSMAKFKIGYYTEQENDYDLMINIGQNSDVEYFVEQVKHYISILNPL
jgi:hypothetical protein